MMMHGLLVCVYCVVFGFGLALTIAGVREWAPGEVVTGGTIMALAVYVLVLATLLGGDD